MPTDEEIGMAIAVLCTLALKAGGLIAGTVDYMPEGGLKTTFHFDVHDAAQCEHDIPMPFPGGTLQ